MDSADLRSPKMKPVGNKEGIIYVLMETPSAADEKSRHPASGDAGEFLRTAIDRRLRDDVRYGYVTRCAVRGRTEKEQQVAQACCTPFLERDILESRPAAIVGVGYGPLKWALSKGALVESWRGRRFPIKIGDFETWFFPVMDPRYVIDNRKNTKRGPVEGPLDSLFRHDLKTVCQLLLKEKLGNPVIRNDLLDDIVCIDGTNPEVDFRRLQIALRKLEAAEIIGIDLETTGLRPYRKDSRILSCAISDGTYTVAFTVNHRRGWPRSWWEKVNELLADFLCDEKQEKVWHNAAFDLEWVANCLHEAILRPNTWGDTMCLAYALDTRKGMLSLDIISFLYLGVRLKSMTDVDKSRLEEEDLQDLLIYNGGDAKSTALLQPILHGRLVEEGGKLKNVYDHLIRTTVTLVLTQKKGLMPNFEALDRFEKQFEQEIIDFEDKLDAAPEVQKFQQLTGSPLQWSSGKQLELLYKNQMDRRDIYADGADKPSFGEEILSKMTDIQSPKIILQLRKVDKLLGTYIKGLRDAIWDDQMIHTQFNLTYTATGRLSSENPNAQNFPKRQAKWIREIIKAPEGFKMVSCDYGQIEARVIAMASKDKRFVDAVKTGYDVHMHWAQRLGKIYPESLDLCRRRYDFDETVDEKKVWKTLRGDMKNGWVFPQFFGSSVRGCATSLEIPVDVAEELAEEFWEMFAGVQDWQAELLDRYEKDGFVSTLTGRRRYAPLSRNEIINTPIQGTASDIVTNAMNVMSELGDWDMQPVINIHDDITFYFPEARVQECIDKAVDIMTTPYFDFINVPLLAEVEIGTHWANQETFGAYETGKGWHGH